MSYPLQTSGARTQARLSRFALCIATSSDDAYSAIEEVSVPGDADDLHSLKSAFRHVVMLLDLDGQGDGQMSGQPPNSLVARYSCLPFRQRVAFALVVIEEFSVEEAAAIMGLKDEEVRQLLLAVRDFLFTSHWSVKSDA
jgi:DNA-directed RNA polymerase specialized sigma24 family protein